MGLEISDDIFIHDRETMVREQIEAAPFDAILLSCAAPEVPRPLWEQLKAGGRFLYPKGAEGSAQELVLVTKASRGPKEMRLSPVRFVPMRRK